MGALRRAMGGATMVRWGELRSPHRTMPVLQRCALQQLLHGAWCAVQGGTKRSGALCLCRQAQTTDTRAGAEVDVARSATSA